MVQAIDALKELFTTVLLPSRKLVFLEQQPLASLPAGNEGRHYLMYFYMEDAIKKRCQHQSENYSQLCSALIDILDTQASKALGLL